MHQTFSTCPFPSCFRSALSSMCSDLPLAGLPSFLKNTESISSRDLPAVCLDLACDSACPVSYIPLTSGHQYHTTKGSIRLGHLDIDIERELTNASENTGAKLPKPYSVTNTLQSDSTTKNCCKGHGPLSQNACGAAEMPIPQRGYFRAILYNCISFC